MELAKPLAYYNMATFTAVKSVTVQGQEQFKFTTKELVRDPLQLNPFTIYQTKHLKVKFKCHAWVAWFTE